MARPVGASAAKTSPLPPSCLIDGSEAHLARETLERLLAGAFPGGEGRDLNLDRFAVESRAVAGDGEESGATSDVVGAAIGAAQTMPFIGDRRVVVLDGVDRLATDGWKRLSAFLADVPPTSSVILIWRRDPDKKEGVRAKTARESLGNAAALWIVCEPPSGAELVSWIRRRAEEKHIRLAPEAASRLADANPEASLGTFDRELERLSTWAGDAPIGAADVEVGGAGRRHTPFQFAEAAVRGAPAEALRILDGLLLHKESPEFILYALTQACRTALPPARRKTVWPALVKADREIKRTQKPPAVIFEQLVGRFAGFVLRRGGP